MRLIVSGLALCLTLLGPLAGQASPDEAADAKNRITLALRQATLVQTMTYNSCFAMAGLDGKTMETAAVEELDSFETVLKGLRDGHEWMGLLPEKRGPMIVAINQNARDTRFYRAAIRQILQQDYHSVVIRQILEGNAQIADASTALAKEFIAGLDQSSIDPKVIAALQLAAHHRMLTQRAIKEMCLVRYDMGGDSMSYILQFTLDEIDTAFLALSEGNDTVSAPPNGRIGRNFRTANLFWAKVRPLIDRVVAGETPTDIEIQKALKLNKSVIKQLNQAIEGYLTSG